MLYQRNLLFFDRQTDSLWSQLLSEAVTGPLAGNRLAVLPAENTTWREWKKEHPESRVLSFLTGYPRDYNQDPYAGYPIRRSLGLLVSAGGKVMLFPFSELKKARSPVVEQMEPYSVSIVFDPRSNTARVQSENMAAVTYFVSFVDDLKAFYPEAEVYRGGRRRK